jgi:N-acetylmuramoyl-L-alanine amidase
LVVNRGPEDSYNSDSSKRPTWHRVNMFRLSPIATSRISRTMATAWRNLVFYWHTHEKGGYVVLIVVALVIVTFAAGIHFSIVGHDRNQDVRARVRALNCLTKNVYHEARGEPVDGQYAVAEVTMNRVASKHYPNTVCEVVFQAKFDVIRKRDVSAFSWTELDLSAPINRKIWNRAWRIAEEVYDDQAQHRVEGALFYHSKSIRPRWSRRKRHIAKIGRHIFY